MSIREARPTFPFVRAKKGFFLSWSRCPPRITWPVPRVSSCLKALLTAPGQPRRGHSALLCVALFSEGAGPRLLLEDPFKPVSGEMGYELPGQGARCGGSDGPAAPSHSLGLLELVGSRGTNSFCYGENPSRKRHHPAEHEKRLLWGCGEKGEGCIFQSGKRGTGKWTRTRQSQYIELRVGIGLLKILKILLRCLDLIRLLSNGTF